MATLSATPRQDRAALGMAMMLVAWALFSLVDSSVKWMTLAGYHALHLAFMRFAVHGAMSAALVLRGGRMAVRPTRGEVGLLLLRAGLLMSSTLLNFFALRYLPLSLTAAIMFSAPLIVAALSGPLLGERVGPWRWGAVVLGFTGVLVVIQPFGEAFHWASLLMVCCATTFALFAILTRRLAGTIPAETMQLYMGIVGTSALLPFALATWQTPQDLREWAVLFGIGFWAWAGHEIFARATSYSDASVLMPFQYSFLLYMTCAGYVLFGTVPTQTTLAGAGLIVASGLVIWWRETRSRRPDDQR